MDDERRACRVLRHHRSTQRKVPVDRADDDRLVADMIELPRQYGLYGYRGIAALLRDAGWHVNDKRVERRAIDPPSVRGVAHPGRHRCKPDGRRREGLKVPMRQPKKEQRSQAHLNDGSCVRRRPEHRNHVWSCDVVHCRTDDGMRQCRSDQWSSDEYSRECLAIRVDRKLKLRQRHRRLE